MLAKFFTLALAATTSVSAFNQGFNYASTKPDGSARVEADFMADFTAAKNLAGTSGFTSARLYTMIQAGSATDPIQAISAAIKTKTTLLLGMWCSAGSDIVDNEITALKNAVNTYGKDFTDLIVGISVGSEDLYRSSAMGIAAKAGIGASPATVAEYIKRVKAAVSTLSIKAPIGHVDTWTAWVDGNNADVISAVDWIGTDAYPYFQSTMSNDISVGGDLLFQAVDNTKGVAQGKDVWLTETGWPVTGKTQNLAVANVANAKSYWDQVACKTIGKMNLYWYTLSDTSPSMTDPSFGIVGSDLSQGPLYDLSCSAQNTTSSSASSSSSASATSSASSSATGASSSSASTTSVADLGSPGGSASNPSSTAAASGSSGMVTSKATGTASATGTAVATYPHVSGNGSASATSMPQPSQATSTGATSFVSVLAIAGSAFVTFYATYFL